MAATDEQLLVAIAAFVVTREAEGLVNLVTAIPMKNDEKFFWAVPGFADAPPGLQVYSSYCDRELAASRSANAAMVLA